MDEQIAPLPWEVNEHSLPPHDLEILACNGRVVARWSGSLLDEIGNREDYKAIFEHIARVANNAKA